MKMQSNIGCIHFTYLVVQLTYEPKFQTNMKCPKHHEDFLTG